MNNSDKEIRIIQKEYQHNSEKFPEKIRIGNQFVDDFIFDDYESADIPINALRVIFNIISIISNEQFRPEDRPKQLSLFDEEFETENNTFASMKIRNSNISPSGSTKQVIDAYEFLTKFKMTWYKSLNAQGREIKTFGGLITAPSYDQRGYTSFLVSSYWLKKLIVIPEYNYLLYHLVYNIRNNKHIIFAIWLAKVPLNGTAIKLATINKKFGLNYKSANDFCFKFLKHVKKNLNSYNSISFSFHYKSDLIYIKPSSPHNLDVQSLALAQDDSFILSRRLRYFKIRFSLTDNEIIHFDHHYRNFPSTRNLIESAFKVFVRACRAKGIKSTSYQGRSFLVEIQNIIIQLYRQTRVGQLLPKGYPIVL